MNTKESTLATEPIIEVESQLAKAFRPVHPSRKFIQAVRSRIQFAPPVIVVNRLSDTRHMLLLIGGVLSASLLIAAGVRMLYYFINKSKA